MSVSTLNRNTSASDVNPATSGVAGLPRGKRNVALLLLAALFAQVAALLVVEGVLSLAGIGEEDISVTDTELGFRHREHKRVTWRQEGYSQSYFGVDGLRENASEQKAAGSFRIMLLGDSFVEGLQEPHEHSFGEQLERDLSAQIHRSVEVLNFGTVGYSTVQEFLQLKRMMPKYHPDAVMLCYTPRDMAETLETWAPAKMKPVGSRPYALKMPGKDLEISNAPVVNSAALPSTKWWSQFDWFRQHSRVWGFFSINKPKVSLKNAVIDTVVNISKNPADGLWQLVKPVMSTASPSFQIRFFEQSQKKKDQWRQKKVIAEVKRRADLEADPSGIMRRTHLQALDDTFGELLGGMQELCRQNNSQLFVMLTPCRSALLPASASVPAPAPALYNVTYKEEIDFVTRHCQAMNIPVVDCQDAASRQPPEVIEKMYFVHHPTRQGNKFLCDHATRLLQRNGNVSAGAR